MEAARLVVALMGSASRVREARRVEAAMDAETPVVAGTESATAGVGAPPVEGATAAEQSGMAALGGAAAAEEAAAARQASQAEAVGTAASRQAGQVVVVAAAVGSWAEVAMAAA